MEPSMSPTEGKIYEATPFDLIYIPIDVQRRMFEGGRLRAARYDGGSKWHVLSDDEMLVREQTKAHGPAPVLSEEEARKPKLDLGCGLSPREGYEGVDLYSKEATHQVDLFKFPWPWGDESVSTLHSSHFLEHVPAREVEARDLVERHGSDASPFLGRDFLFAVMDECHRILVPGGDFTIVVPCARSDGAFQDPTHRRFWNQNTFLYFNRDGRDMLHVAHYRTETDFLIIQRIPVGPTIIGLMNPEVQAERWNRDWNAVLEWHVILRKRVKKG